MAQLCDFTEGSMETPPDRPRPKIEPEAVRHRGKVFYQVRRMSNQIRACRIVEQAHCRAGQSHTPSPVGRMGKVTVAVQRYALRNRLVEIDTNHVAVNVLHDEGDPAGQTVAMVKSGHNFESLTRYCYKFLFRHVARHSG